jgi:hypothetical protein
MLDKSRLDEQQEKLLIDLVEAERRTPREERRPFLIARTVGPPGVQLLHGGWKERDRRVFEGDIDTLATARLIAKTFVGNGREGFYVTPAGFSHYAEVARRLGEPLERVTVARIRSVLEHLAGLLGATEKPLLDALLTYWGTVSDLVQRQEHGAQREGESLSWADSRRVVFQTA